MRNTKNLKVLFSLMLVFAVISTMFMTVMAEPEDALIGEITRSKGYLLSILLLSVAAGFLRLIDNFGSREVVAQTHTARSAELAAHTTACLR